VPLPCGAGIELVLLSGAVTYLFLSKQLEFCVGLARSTLLNLSGQVVPLAAALWAMPLLIERLDPARFGFLSLVWVLVGYFSLLDLGLGRALTRLIAERTGTACESGLIKLSQTAVFFLLLVGGLLGFFLFLLAPWLCTSVLKFPLELQAQAKLGLQTLVLCLPFVTLTAAYRGVLEARHRFGWVNALRIPLGVLLFLVPVVVTSFSTDLFNLCLALGVLRILGAFAHWSVCVWLYPTLTSFGYPDLRALKEMLSYGIWLTISNIVGPLMVYLDRFFIGSLVSVAAVAYYTAPYEVVTRLWLVPASLTGVLFPVFAFKHFNDPKLTQRLYHKATLVLLAAMLPLTFLTGFMADTWLTAWLGQDYASEGLQVAQILCVGVFFNSLGHLPFSLLQATGRADLTAKLHLLELPLYIAALAWLVPEYGINGAAWVWAGRCSLDAVSLFVLGQLQLRSVNGLSEKLA
jgi:O-antigen/teichoic acid export membrane protein